MALVAEKCPNDHGRSGHADAIGTLGSRPLAATTIIPRRAGTTRVVRGHYPRQS